MPVTAPGHGAAALHGSPVARLPGPRDQLTPGAAAIVRALPRLGWTIVSVGAFALLWELLWALGVTDPKLLPPPHVFLGEMADQAKFFNTAQRWQIGVDADAGPAPWQAVLLTVLASTTRVFAGIAIASVLALSLGVAIRYWVGVERLVLPTVTLLSPVSPIAWLPVAIFLFGIGNAPAIFMVAIALFFHMTIATINRIDDVDRHLINVGRTMGATRAQIYRHVVVPAILPGVFAILRLNLFAAWMVVLIAESTGVGYGLGTGHHARAQHVQPLARVLLHRADRTARVHHRLVAPGRAAARTLLARRHRGDAPWPLTHRCSAANRSA